MKRSKIIPSIIQLISWLIPFKLLLKGSYPPFIPFYHFVGNERPQHIGPQYSISEKQFVSDLDFILKHFTPVDLETIQQNPKLEKPPIHFTFDDGLRECATVIAPILKKRNIPATFFINSAFIDNNSLFHRFKTTILEEKGVVSLNDSSILNTSQLDELAFKQNITFHSFLKDQKPYLSKNEVNGLIDNGFTIGAHSVNHPEFWLLSDKEQLQQITESINYLKNEFHLTTVSFAFPFTDDRVKKETINIVLKNNIASATFGTAGLKKDSICGHFQRITMETQQNYSANLRLKQEMLAYKLKKLIGKHNVKHA